MIYQSNNEFKVFSFQADFSGKKEYLTDKTEFEKMLLEIGIKINFFNI